jgi:UDP-N-acetylglucosamine acyltransferase
MPPISANAIVEKGAELADDVRVGPFAYIGPHVRIGPGCTIDGGASLTGRTTLGARCRVFPFAVIGAEGGAAGCGECVIGQANSIREHVTICAGAEDPTRIGDDNLIMIGCRIGPGAVIGDHCILTNCTQIEGLARIDDYVGTSAFTFVAAKARVGSYTYIAGYTGVEGDAPPYAMLQGYPARVRGVNSNKLRRCGFGDEDIRALKEAFRDLFNGSADGLAPDVLRRLSADATLNAHVRRVVEAMRDVAGRDPQR